MPRSGITYAPEFEWFEAAIWANYTDQEFEELDGDRQARIVAAYETHNQIEAVVNQEQARQAVARSKRKK